MATVEITDQTVRVHLTTRERVAALHSSFTIDRDQIVAVESVSNAVAAPRGLRSPGLALPGRVKIGVWRSRAGRQFVDVRRGIPGVRLRLKGHRYHEVLLSIADPATRERLLSLGATSSQS